jgi:hypothetical protein
MSTFIALTTTNPQNGWEFLGTAPSREDASRFEPVLSDASDLYAQTRFRNFRVVSKTKAREYLGRAGAELAAKGIDPAEAGW